MPEFYVLDGHTPVPCANAREWAMRFESADCQVADTRIGCLRVSTVFLGIDHNHARMIYGDNSPPILFETMIFGDDYDSHQMRCATWEQAEAMHAEAVKIAVEWVRRADAMVVGLPRSD